MRAKTIFLNAFDKEIIYESMWHTDNHHNYITKYYKNLKIDDYIPILLTKYNNCVIELSKSYQIGVIYLPESLSLFQKEYFNKNKKELEKYTLYLNNYSLQDSIPVDELINKIKEL